MSSEAARALALARWAKTPIKERGKHVGHNGGRPWKHGRCPRSPKGYHQFNRLGKCACGKRKE